MKALSLWQPWASLMAAGLKTIETRGWLTGYRGPLAIHAAKRCMGVEERELIQNWRNAQLIGWEWPGTDLPYGAILAVVELFECVRTIDLVNSWYRTSFPPDQYFGNYAPGRWAWITRNWRALPQPIPWRGKQGVFEVPDSIFQKEG